MNYPLFSALIRSVAALAAQTPNCSGVSGLQTAIPVFDRQPDAAPKRLRKPDETAGEEHQEVRCFTCHEGKPKSQSRPAFQ